MMVRDTSSWWMAGTTDNPRIYDLRETDRDEARWTVGLVEHLCTMEDERIRLRAALTLIDAQTDLKVCRSIAANALQSCYHQWLIEDAVNCRCPICGQISTRAEQERLRLLATDPDADPK